ncbi:MAG: hypothetical protein ACRDQW_02320 [Haloechinothrix sp.]
MTDSITLPLVEALENTWRAIQKRHPDVPDVMLTLGAGSIGDRGTLRLGHFAAARWQIGKAERLPELFVGGEGLNRPAPAILGTLLHEAAHGVAHVRGIQDTSRQGRFHNRRFKALAEELGITVEQTGNIGWSETNVPDHTAGAYQTEIDQLTAALKAYRHREPGAAGGHGTGRGRTSNNNGVSAACNCGRRIRTPRSTYEAGSIVCGLCGTDFTTAG